MYLVRKSQKKTKKIFTFFINFFHYFFFQMKRARETWTYERFCRSKRNDEFDYSLVGPYDTMSWNAPITLICKACNDQFSTTIHQHVNEHQPCPLCGPNARWTLTRFKIQANLVHGNAYDYSAIKPYHIRTAQSHVPITCRTCDFPWRPTIAHHVTAKSGCPKCAGNLPWTYVRFIAVATLLFGASIIFDNIRPEDVVNCLSRLSLKCATCDWDWISTLQNLIYGKHGCPRCNWGERWTRTRFLREANAKYGGKFLYGPIPENITSQTKIHITCTDCEYEFYRCARDHIYINQNCAKCAKMLQWTTREFKLRATEIHNHRYDYSLIEDDEIITARSKVRIICRQCNSNWECTVSSHISGRTGCPRCNRSHAEIKCEEILTELDIVFTPQYRLTNRRKAYDFHFVHNGVKCLLEYDGIQHFKWTPCFQPTEIRFRKQQSRDIRFTLQAIEQGYYMIRIDYTCEKAIAHHIQTALVALITFTSPPKPTYYFSKPEMYAHILRQLSAPIPMGLTANDESTERPMKKLALSQ